MLQVLQLFSCGLFTLAICFYFGKRWGERKFLKMKEEMKAYETAFTQLIEQMEMVSKHNLKVLETKTEDLRELIPVLDKKLLYADDLMRELENTKTEVSRPGKLKLEAPSDLKLRREMQELISSLRGRLEDLESRLEVMENIEHERGPIGQMPARDGNYPPPGGDSKWMDPKIARNGELFEGAYGEKLEMNGSTGEKIVRLPEKIQIAKAKFIAENISKLHSSAVMESACPSKLRHEPPRPGTVLHEVLALQDKGIPLPQIARRMNMALGEVEVIMNIYGAKPSMRKIS